MKNKDLRVVFVLKFKLFLSKFRKTIVKNLIFSILEIHTVTLLRLPFQTKCKKQIWNIFIFDRVDTLGVFAFGGHLGFITVQPVDQKSRNLIFYKGFDTGNIIKPKANEKFKYSGK